MDDSGSEVTIAMRFRDFGGAFMEHCHNTQHEDHSMLLRWDIENPGQLKPFLTPEPQWNGCTYTESFDLSTARSQADGAQKAPELVGDWKAREDFLKDGNAAGLLCAAGATESCASGTTAASGGAASSGNSSSASGASSSASAPSNSSSSSSASEPSVTTGGDDSPKKHRGRKRGRGGSGGGRGQKRSASLQN
jgi:hypothetical protein